MPTQSSIVFIFLPGIGNKIFRYTYSKAQEYTKKFDTPKIIGINSKFFVSVIKGLKGITPREQLDRDIDFFGRTVSKDDKIFVFDPNNIGQLRYHQFLDQLLASLDIKNITKIELDPKNFESELRIKMYDILARYQRKPRRLRLEKVQYYKGIPINEFSGEWPRIDLRPYMKDAKNKVFKDKINK